MTRETKVGLMMVALLVGVFGFLIYKRVHRPAEALAHQETTNVTRDLEAADNIRDSRESSKSPFDEFEAPVERKPSIKAARFDDISDEAPRQRSFAEDKPKRLKPKRPAPVAENDFDFDQVTERRAAKEPARVEPQDDSVGDPFAETPSLRKANRIIAQVSEATDADPFGDPSADEKELADEPVRQEPKMLAPPRRDKPRALPKELEERSNARAVTVSNEEVEEVESVFEEPDQVESSEPERVDRLDAVRDTNRRPGRADRQNVSQTGNDFSGRLEPAPRAARRAAPTEFDDSFSPESSARPLAAVSGSTYLVEPNDNFWIIARKRYGAGRYYMALAQHNQHIIPDPKRMKPGITIVTPDVSVLEQKYAQIIPKAAPPGAAPVTTAHARKSEESGPPGYFVAADGAPMYRIGEQDTLSEIAKTHLGRSSRWVQILEINRNVLRDGNELRIGTVLRLPADASRVQMVGASREYR